ncbi:MAG: alpha/beta hydrolase [Specibacter sp.]
MAQESGQQQIRTWIRLPGMLCTAEIFTVLDPYLDLGGTDVDTHIRGGTLDEAAENLLALARSQEGPVGIIGLSLGAIVAMAAMVKGPEAFHAAVLISTTPRGPRPEQITAWDAMAKQTQNGAFLKVLNGLEPALFAPSQATTARLNSARAMAENIGQAPFVEQLGIQTSRRDLRPELPQICASTLVLAGSKDQLCNREVHQDIAAGIPNSELHVLAGQGHLLTLESPAPAANIINLWNLRRTT